VTLPQSNQELLLVRDKDGKPPRGLPSGALLLGVGDALLGDRLRVSRSRECDLLSLLPIFLGCVNFVSSLIRDTFCVVMSPPLIGAFSDDTRLTSDVCLSVSLSVAYIGPTSRTERPRKTK